jgi:hypothetical protein
MPRWDGQLRSLHHTDISHISVGPIPKTSMGRTVVSQTLMVHLFSIGVSVSLKRSQT